MEDHQYVQPIIDAGDMSRIIRRLAHEILEQCRGVERMVLVGVRTRGVILAGRIHQIIEDVEKTAVPLGQLDVTPYRDDRPDIDLAKASNRTALPFPVADRHVVVIDDVLYTGRTIRAAMDALIDRGRPQRIALAVLVDRGHRELPIQADFVGKSLETRPADTVSVQFQESDGIDRVTVAFGPLDQR